MPQDDVTLLRMRATAAGFEIEHGREAGWLKFGSAGNLAVIWLHHASEGPLAAAGPLSVTREIRTGYGIAAIDGPIPTGASAGWRCANYASLESLCRRIAILGLVLPDQVLHRFEREVAEAVTRDQALAPTERLAEVRQRVGQDRFREALMDYWEGRCAITGVSEPTLLRASHAKPWRDATDRERLDVHNGLLLVAHLDAAFDAGLITVAPDGAVHVAARLGGAEREILGVDRALWVDRLVSAHEKYLSWHRERVFRRIEPA